MCGTGMVVIIIVVMVRVALTSQRVIDTDISWVIRSMKHSIYIYIQYNIIQYIFTHISQQRQQ